MLIQIHWLCFFKLHGDWRASQVLEDLAGEKSGPRGQVGPLSGPLPDTGVVSGGCHSSMDI